MSTGPAYKFSDPVVKATLETSASATLTLHLLNEELESATDPGERVRLIGVGALALGLLETTVSAAMAALADVTKGVPASRPAAEAAKKWLVTGLESERTRFLALRAEASRTTTDRGTA